MKNFKFIFRSFLAFLAFCYAVNLNAQVDTSNVSFETRKGSGLDPTNFNSRLGYSAKVFVKSDKRLRINNDIGVLMAFGNSNITFKYEVVTINPGTEGEGFDTKGGDFKLGASSVVWAKGKNAIATGLEFTIPTGPQGFGDQYFALLPSFTFVHSFDPSFLLALQPNYLFSISKNPEYPNLSVLTLRPFLAKFQPSGWYYVFENRLVFNFSMETFDIFISPIVGKSIGNGFNAIVLMEVPTTRQTIDNTGISVQFGLNKNF